MTSNTKMTKPIRMLNGRPVVAILPDRNGREYVVVIHDVDADTYGTGYWRPGWNHWVTGSYHYATLSDAINAGLWQCGVDAIRQRKPSLLCQFPSLKEGGV